MIGVFALDYARGKHYGASQYYRIDVPLQAMRARGGHEYYIDKGIDDRTLMADFMTRADIVQNTHFGSDGMEALAQFLKDAQPAETLEGVRMPPVFIQDVEDDFDNVHPWSWAFGHLGHRDVTGQKLNIGDRIVYPEADGTLVELWRDKEMYAGIDGTEQIFDIQRNRDFVESCLRVACLAQGVTVTTPYLKTVMENRGCKHVYVYPNSIQPKDYEMPRLEPHTGVRLVWQGGVHHVVDWKYYAAALGEVLTRNPTAHMTWWSNDMPVYTRQWPEAQVTIKPWCHYAEYKLRRGLIDCDINICTLAPFEFNKSISCIKWYEGAIFGEATVAPNMEPYNREIVDGETGLLYEPADGQSFAEAVQTLIDKPALRYTLGQNAKKWVLENRHADKTVEGLIDFYEDCRARKRRELRALVSA